MCILLFILTLWEMLVFQRYFKKERKDKQKIAQSKAADSDRKEKSRHVQEPPRKDGKCIRFYWRKEKHGRSQSHQLFFPTLVLPSSPVTNVSQRISRYFIVWARERVRTDRTGRFEKLRQFLNWGKHRKWQSVLTPLIKTFNFCATDQHTKNNF